MLTSALQDVSLPGDGVASTNSMGSGGAGANSNPHIPQPPRRVSPLRQASASRQSSVPLTTPCASRLTQRADTAAAIAKASAVESVTKGDMTMAEHLADMDAYRVSLTRLLQHHLRRHYLHTVVPRLGAHGDDAGAGGHPGSSQQSTRPGGSRASSRQRRDSSLAAEDGASSAASLGHVLHDGRVATAEALEEAVDLAKLREEAIAAVTARHAASRASSSSLSGASPAGGASAGFSLSEAEVEAEVQAMLESRRRAHQEAAARLSSSADGASGAPGANSHPDGEGYHAAQAQRRGGGHRGDDEHHHRGSSAAEGWQHDGDYDDGQHDENGAIMATRRPGGAGHPHRSHHDRQAAGRGSLSSSGRRDGGRTRDQQNRNPGPTRSGAGGSSTAPGANRFAAAARHVAGGGGGPNDGFASSPVLHVTESMVYEAEVLSEDDRAALKREAKAVASTAADIHAAEAARIAKQQALAAEIAELQKHNNELIELAKRVGGVAEVEAAVAAAADSKGSRTKGGGHRGGAAARHKHRGRGAAADATPPEDSQPPLSDIIANVDDIASRHGKLGVLSRMFSSTARDAASRDMRAQHIEVDAKSIIKALRREERRARRRALGEEIDTDDDEGKSSESTVDEEEVKQNHALGGGGTAVVGGFLGIASSLSPRSAAAAAAKVVGDTEQGVMPFGMRVSPRSSPTAVGESNLPAVGTPPPAARRRVIGTPPPGGAAKQTVMTTGAGSDRGGGGAGARGGSPVPTKAAHAAGGGGGGGGGGESASSPASAIPLMREADFLAFRHGKPAGGDDAAPGGLRLDVDGIGDASSSAASSVLDLHAGGILGLSPSTSPRAAARRTARIKDDDEFSSLSSSTASSGDENEERGRRARRNGPSATPTSGARRGVTPQSMTPRAKPISPQSAAATPGTKGKGTGKVKGSAGASASTVPTASATATPPAAQTSVKPKGSSNTGGASAASVAPPALAHSTGPAPKTKKGVPSRPGVTTTTTTAANSSGAHDEASGPVMSPLMSPTSKKSSSSTGFNRSGTATKKKQLQQRAPSTAASAASAPQATAGRSAQGGTASVNALSLQLPASNATFPGRGAASSSPPGTPATAAAAGAGGSTGGAGRSQRNSPPHRSTKTSPPGSRGASRGGRRPRHDAEASSHHEGAGKRRSPPHTGHGVKKQPVVALVVDEADAKAAVAGAAGRDSKEPGGAAASTTSHDAPPEGRPRRRRRSATGYSTSDREADVHAVEAAVRDLRRNLERLEHVEQSIVGYQKQMVELANVGRSRSPGAGGTLLDNIRDTAAELEDAPSPTTTKRRGTLATGSDGAPLLTRGRSMAAAAFGDSMSLGSGLTPAMKEMAASDLERIREEIDTARNELTVAHEELAVMKSSLADRKQRALDVRRRLREEISNLQVQIASTAGGIDRARDERTNLVKRYVLWRRRREFDEDAVAATFEAELELGPRSRDAETQCVVQSETLPMQVLKLVRMMEEEDALKDSLRIIRGIVRDMDEINRFMRLEISCPVCRGIFQNCVVMWPCGHSFCGACFDKLQVAPGAFKCRVCGTIGSDGYTGNCTVNEVVGRWLFKKSGFSDVVTSADEVQVQLSVFSRSEVQKMLRALAAVSQHL